MPLVKLALATIIATYLASWAVAADPESTAVAIG